MSQAVWIGVMSGTSLDAVDVVAVRFNPLQPVGFLSRTFPSALREMLLALTQSGPDEIERLGQAEVAYSQFVAETVQQLIAQYHIEPRYVMAIGCHGQTLRHRPTLGFTLQLIDGNRLAEVCGIPVVTDFRRRDIAAGGQGAPLVPAFHRAIFQDQHQHHVVLNLGGIANITVLPAGQPDQVTGFDTGPANLLLDGWCQRHTGQPFDDQGQWAASGQILPDLLQQLMREPYFQKAAPKSTGRELFHLAWLDQQLASISYRPIDVQATLTELTAQSVAQEIQRLAQDGMASGVLIVCGGGSFNTYLRKRLSELLPNWPNQLSDDFGLAAQTVEAVAFAWLARQRIYGQPGNLPAVTGAAGERILGALYWP